MAAGRVSSSVRSSPARPRAEGAATCLWMCPTVARIRERFARHGLETTVHLNHSLSVSYSVGPMAVEAARLLRPRDPVATT